jgi:predicted RNase H-like HicB family nuclease
MALRFYPALISKDPDTDFGVVFLDLPGCVSAGETVQEAAEHAAEALALHIEGMLDAGEPVPPASAPDAPLPDWLADIPGETVARVLVPVEMPGRVSRVNVTLDEGLLARLDAAATSEGMSRSGYIAQAVRERLRRPLETA